MTDTLNYCAWMIIGITSIVDYNSLVISDFSWISLLILSAFKNPEQHSKLVYYFAFTLAIIKINPYSSKLGEGDWYYMLGLGFWCGLDSIGLMVGLACLFALGTEIGGCVICGDRIDWQKKIPFGLYLSISSLLFQY